MDYGVCIALNAALAVFYVGLKVHGIAYTNHCSIECIKSGKMRMERSKTSDCC